MESKEAIYTDQKIYEELPLKDLGRGDRWVAGKMGLNTWMWTIMNIGEIPEESV